MGFDDQYMDDERVDISELEPICHGCALAPRNRYMKTSDLGKELYQTYNQDGKVVGLVTPRMVCDTTNDELKCINKPDCITNEYGEIECVNPAYSITWLNIALTIIIYLAVFAAAIWALFRPSQSSVALLIFYVILFWMINADWDSFWFYIIVLIFLFIVFILFVKYVADK